MPPTRWNLLQVSPHGFRRDDLDGTAGGDPGVDPGGRKAWSPESSLGANAASIHTAPHVSPTWRVAVWVSAMNWQRVKRMEKSRWRGRPSRQWTHRVARSHAITALVWSVRWERSFSRGGQGKPVTMLACEGWVVGWPLGCDVYSGWFHRGNHFVG